jgi:hypothetical protein
VAESVIPQQVPPARYNNKSHCKLLKPPVSLNLMNAAGVVTHRQTDMLNIICEFVKLFLTNAPKSNISNISENNVQLDFVTIANVMQLKDMMRFIFIPAFYHVLYLLGL